MGFTSGRDGSSSESSNESILPTFQANRRAPTKAKMQVHVTAQQHVRSRRKAPHLFSMTKLDAITNTRMEGAYARTTWKRRALLDREWQRFKLETHQEPTSTTAVRFFSWLSTNLLDTSLHTYVTTFLAMHPELKTTETKTYLRAIKKMGGLRPSSEVPGLTKEEAYKVMHACPPPLQLIFFIAWKTASRWADVRALRPQDIVQVAPNQAAILFPCTKATWVRPFRPDLFVHLIHKSDITYLLKQVQNLNPGRPIVNVSTQQITTLMRKVLKKKNVSSRSIKKGAADTLMTAAAQGALPVDVVGRLLKHAKTPQLLHDTSCRYTTNKAMLAVALGSGQATKLL